MYLFCKLKLLYVEYFNVICLFSAWLNQSLKTKSYKINYIIWELYSENNYLSLSRQERILEQQVMCFKEFSILLCNL